MSEAPRGAQKGEAFGKLTCLSCAFARGIGKSHELGRQLRGPQLAIGHSLWPNSLLSGSHVIPSPLHTEPNWKRELVSGWTARIVGGAGPPYLTPASMTVGDFPALAP